MSAGGTIPGAFYRILVDRELSGFAATVARGVALYTVCTLLQATSRWVSEYVALRYALSTSPSRVTQYGLIACIQISARSCFIYPTAMSVAGALTTNTCG